MAIFPLTNKMKYKHADYYIYIPNTEKLRQMNQMPAIYAVLCDCQMFQVNFVPSLVPN